MNYLESFCLLSGRALLGLYFILPGLQKITNFEAMSQYMEAHNVPLFPVLLIVTIIIQLVAGAALIVGYRGNVAAFVLAGLTLVISLYMHNFWAMEESVARGHEMQNFVKNMAIMAGLLVVAALGTGNFSLDSRSARTIRS
ncbi:MAG: DoxX family protein [Pseudomonadales bacterium]